MDYYGLTNEDIKAVEKKLAKQSLFLENTVYQNNQTGVIKPLKELIISSNHSPHRYYALTQNRVNTLQQIAKEQELVPVFLTITLPGKYHRCKVSQNGRLIPNPKYEGYSPKEGSEELTKMFQKLRHDRAFKELSKDERMYFRAIEPHKDGTPHTHILLFIPKDRVEQVVKAFKRLYPAKGNDIQTDIKDAVGYVMKYINKMLPKSKDNLTKKERYLNVWYAHHRILRFSSSRTLAPLALYKLLQTKFTLYDMTKLYQPLVYSKEIGCKVHPVVFEKSFLEITKSSTGRIELIELCHYDIEFNDLDMVCDDRLYKANRHYSIINLSTGVRYA